MAYGTWWRNITTSSSQVSGGTLASWDTTTLDNSYHTLRLIVKDEAGNTSVQLIAVKTGNSGRFNMEEVTTDPLDIIPDITADGQKIAFTSDRMGYLDTWIMNSDGTNLSSSLTSTSDDRHPSFSPDGQKIVFMSDRSGSGNFDIYKQNIDGTELTQLTSGSSFESVPTWSADGQKIVYASDQHGSNDIFIMNSDGEGQTRLTTSSANDWFPDISPDGQKIVFDSNRNGSYDIFSMNSNGTGLTQLTNLQSNERHPSFSPDGQKIVFQLSRAGDNNIWAMNVDGTNLQKLTDDSAPDAVPTWAPDNSKIVYASSRSGLCDIYTMNIDGTNEQRVSFSVRDFVPDINHDSSKVAFSSTRARDYTSGVIFINYQCDIYLINPDGANLNLISDLSYYSHHPSFSPDGQSLVFCSDKSGNYNIWKMNIDGTGLTQLTNTPTKEYVPSWSHGGNKIAYHSDASVNDDIYIMNQDGKLQTALTSGPLIDRFPDVTADGQKVIFSSGSGGIGSGREDTYIVNADGTGLTQITTDPNIYEWHPSFNPSGDKFNYTRGDSSNPSKDLYQMNIDGTGNTRLTYDQAKEVVNTWSPDGKTVVFSTARTSTNGEGWIIWKINLLSEQSPIVETPSGNNVNIILRDDLSIIFENVNSSGETSATFSTPPPEGPPAGFQVVGLDSDYFDILTTATFSGLIEVKIKYDPSKVQGPEENLQMLHWTAETGWENCTKSVDTVNKYVIGEVDHFSIFATGEYYSGSPTGVNKGVLLLIGALILLTGVILRRRYITSSKEVA